MDYYLENRLSNFKFAFSTRGLFTWYMRPHFIGRMILVRTNSIHSDIMAELFR